MPRSTALYRITFGLACLSVSLMMAAKLLGLLPDRARDIVEGRKALCEAIAVDYSLAVEHGDLQTVRKGLAAIVKRNPDVLSAGLRWSDGKMLVEIGDHRAYWAEGAGDKSTTTRMFVPISAANKPWGTVELCFREPGGPFLGPFFLYDLGLLLFVAVAGSIVFYLYLHRVLGRLNPSKVIPQRVRNTLNTLAEGLLVLDNRERIVLANEAFAKTIGVPASDLAGRDIAGLPWALAGSDDGPSEYPWTASIRTGSLQADATVRMKSSKGGMRTFKVNSSPILAEDDGCRGVLASFEDITLLEQRTARLSDTLGRLKRSRDQIRKQNEQLTALATRDPLTMCLNRRAFHDQFERQLVTCRQAEKPLSCLLLDIDHFKAFNDNHGHATGDEVLKMVALVMTRTIGESGSVGRYGGEEFCVSLPGRGIREAAATAERIRVEIESTGYGGLRVTTSLGVSSTEFNASDQRMLLEKDDKAIYVSKRGGRNRVGRCDQIPSRDQPDPRDRPSSRQPDNAGQEPIPFHAVSVLVAVLQYRHAPIAEHCRRVADQCVAVAEELMSEWDRYVLEVAALLHDIGKLSVPDSILLKEGPLTDRERKLMRTYERVGVDILSATFASSDLNAVVRCRNAWFGGTPHDESLPTGEQIPLGARLLFIAEAYDAIVSAQPYRDAANHDEAIAELRRGAGTQFDPQLVEHFIAVVSGQGEPLELARKPSPGHVALRIGVQVEKLACALDAEDSQSLVEIAGQLEHTAAQNELRELAEAASSIVRQARCDADWTELVHLGADLIELCRLTQSAIIGESLPA